MGLAYAHQVWMTYDTSCNYTQQTQDHKNQKTPTPWSPPPAGFQRLQFYRWVWLPCVAQLISISATWQCNFNDETNIFFILLTIILQASDRHAQDLKVSYFSDYLFFFLAVAPKQCAITPAICWYLFCRYIPSICHDLPWFCTTSQNQKRAGVN